MKNKVKIFFLSFFILSVFIPACGYLIDRYSYESPQQKALIIAVGDVMAHTPQINQAFVKEKEVYDFSPSFKYIRKHIEKGDLAVCNFESTFGGSESTYRGYPRFSAPDELAMDLKNAGFNIVCTANNHSLDSGEEGLYRTIDVFDKAGMKNFGTARNYEERRFPLIADANGIKIAFLAYTDSTNLMAVPEDREYMVNFIDTNNLKKAEEILRDDIKRCRRAGAEIVAVYMHWSGEYNFEPDEIQKKLALKAARSGADLILGSHPHVIQPMEYIELKDYKGEKRKAFVAYSMGNFISNQCFIPERVPTDEVEIGKILKIYVEREGKNDARVDDVRYVLSWVNRYDRHRVIPLYDVINSSAGTYGISSQKKSELTGLWEKVTKRLKGFAHADIY